MNASATAAFILALIALVAVLRVLSLNEKNSALTAKNGVLSKTNERLRKDVETTRIEADTAIRNRDTAVEAANALQAELAKSHNWNDELRRAQMEHDSYLMTTRNERRDAWTSQMHARMNAPDAIPPHEQPKDGDQ